MQIKTGFYYRAQYGLQIARYYEEPKPKSNDYFVMETREYDDTKYPFKYKGGNLKSLLSDRSFSLIYDYDYVYPMSRGIRLDNEKERKGKFILTEKINSIVSVLARIDYNPEYDTYVTKFKREGDNDDLKSTLRRIYWLNYFRKWST